MSRPRGPAAWRTEGNRTVEAAAGMAVTGPSAQRFGGALTLPYGATDRCRAQELARKPIRRCRRSFLLHRKSGLCVRGPSERRCGDEEVDGFGGDGVRTGCR